MPTITADTTPQFPACPAYGFRADPFLLVKIIAREGGYERVNRKWSQARRQYDGTPIGDRAQEDVEDILYFWLAIGGMAGRFRFKDLTDFKSCRLGDTVAAIDQALVELDTSPLTYQLTKSYTVGALTHARPIRRPVGSTVLVANEVGALQSDWTLDEATGIITPGPTFSGTATAAGFEFEVLCRFNDSFAPQIVNHEIQSAEVSLIEIRETGQSEMRTDISAELLAHLQSGELTTAICWLISKRDGTFIRGTEHDRDIVVTTTGDLAGTYRAGANIIASTVQSGSDLAPDNMDVDGAIPEQSADYIDVSVSDIEGGLLRLAPVTVFFVNWAAPDDGQAIIRRGFLGEITRDSDGRYTTEIRGLLQLLSQQFIETYSERCVVKRFGDERCKLDLAPFTHTGTVTAVTSRKAFATDLSMSPYPDFRGAAFTFTSGDNDGYLRESKAGDSGEFTFWEPFPETPQVGDTFSVVQACDRSRTACIGYANLVNFRGHGIFVPGVDALSRGPT